MASARLLTRAERFRAWVDRTAYVVADRQDQAAAEDQDLAFDNRRQPTQPDRTLQPRKVGK